MKVCGKNGATRGEALERHLATIVLLNAVFALVLLFAGAWLIRSANRAVDQGTLPVHVIAGGTCFAAATLSLLLAWGLRRGLRVARWGQMAVAAGVLPVVPVGTAWGAYVFWALRLRSGAHDPKPDPRHAVQPLYSVAVPAIFAGVALLTFGLLKANELWLTHRISTEAAQEDGRRLAVDRSFARLRALSADDLVTPRPGR